jgi:dihydroorotate dehydrogenase
VQTLALKCLHLLAPETAHRASILALKAGLVPGARADGDAALAVRRFGLDFPNPLGLAAGYDKDAEVPDAVLRLGFGFTEVGSITPRPQPGNPRPRLFRLTADRAVINRMGFNNGGLAAAQARLAARAGRPGILGVNLGANKDSADMAADYATGAAALAPFASYLVVNVSSPNTPGLRDLQTKPHLATLLDGVRAARISALPAGTTPPPVLVKIAPDFADADLDTLAVALAELAVDGIIVSNTTIERPAGLVSPDAGEAGGLSGRPLFEKSTRALARVYRATGGAVPLVGVGGIEDGATAYAKIRAGASLLQLYSALVYEGPGLAARICRDLGERLRADGFTHLDEAVGLDAEKY